MQSVLCFLGVLGPIRFCSTLSVSCGTNQWISLHPGGGRLPVYSLLLALFYAHLLGDTHTLRYLREF